MATNFNASQYALSDSVWKNIADNDNENRAQTWNAITSLANTGINQYNQYKDNKLIQANTDENGKFNQQGYLAALAQDNPALAQQKRQQFLTQDLGNAKLQQEIALKQAQAGQAKSLADYNNAKSHSEGATAFLNQLSIAQPSNQQEFDNLVAKAKNMGFPVDGFEGKTYSPNLIADARKSIASYKDTADAAMAEKKLELDKLKQQDESRNIDSQIGYRTGQLTNQNASTNLDTQKFEETKNQNDFNNALSERKVDQGDRQLNQGDKKIDISEKQANASIGNMNIKNQADALDRVSSIRQQQSVMSRMANTINDIMSFPIDDYVGKQQTIASSEIAEKARSNTQLQNFLNTVKNFHSQAFLDAISAMKGMGALSDAEGKKLSAGYSALNVNSTPEEFKRQLRIIYSRLNDGYSTAQGKVSDVNKVFGSNYQANNSGLPAFASGAQQTGVSQSNPDPVINTGQPTPTSNPAGMPDNFNGVPSSRIQELLRTGRY